MNRTNKTHSGRFMLLLLVAGAMITLVALISAPSLMAQDDNIEDEKPQVYQVRTLEEFEALPQEVKDSFPEGTEFYSADSFDISESTKTVGRNQALAGDRVTYTIVAKNSGQVSTGDASIEDALPNDLTYVEHTVEIQGALPDQQDPGGEENGVVTWNGSIGPQGQVTIEIVADIRKNAEVGAVISNTAIITAGDQTVQPTVEITVVDANSMPLALLPMITYGERPLTPDIVSIEATRPTRANSWTVSWNGAGAVSYELQESYSPGFESPTSLMIGPEASRSFSYPPTRNNTRYYRVRSKAGEINGNWSQTLKVVGGYRDDFDIPLDRNYPFTPPMWGIRRTTNLSEVHTWNEFPGDYKWNILNLSDAYEMGLASPMMEAPEVPYSIRLELKSVDPSEGLGTGFVFAGDKQTERCPNSAATTAAWYEHKDCFNQFYEFMLIEAAAGERIDLQIRPVYNVIWNGSGDDPVTFEAYDRWKELDISGVDWGDWNAFGVDVYEDHIDVFAGRRGQLRYRWTIDGNYYPTNPYFGTIATTGERPKVTARYEYFEVLPIDN